MLWRTGGAVGEGVLAPTLSPLPTVLGGVLSRDPDPNKYKIAIKIVGILIYITYFSLGVILFLFLNPNTNLTEFKSRMFKIYILTQFENK